MIRTKKQDTPFSPVGSRAVRVYTEADEGRLPCCAEFLVIRKLGTFYFYREVLNINAKNSKDLAINENINFAPSKLVRVVGAAGEQIGQLSFAAAQREAYDKGLDLVLIAPGAEPPVCRIMDYGKYRFERDKKEKEARKKQQTVEVKEIQLSCLIDTNDFNTKVNHAHRFLSAGNKVKVIVKFKGRQMTHQEIGRDLLTKFQQACEDAGTVDKAPVLEGRYLSMFILPLKQTAGKDQKAAKSAEKGPAAK